MSRLVALVSSIVASLLVVVPDVAAQVQRAPRARTPVDAVPPTPLATVDWSSIRAAYEAGRHAAYAVAGGHRARNPGQQWRTYFDGRGFTTTPDAGGWTWGVDLESYGWGDGGRIVTAPQSVSAKGGRVTYVWDDQLTEWYVNDQRGLEHGYTLLAKPASADGPLTLSLAIRGGLLPHVSADGRDVRFADAAGDVVLTYAGLTVADAEGRALTAGWKARGRALELHVADQGARYPLTIDPIAQQAYVKASNTGSNDLFGQSSSLSGETLVVGAPQEGSDATGVNGDQSNDNSFHSGAAYVFVRNGNVWSQQAYLKASNTGAGDLFGISVAISGDTIVVGASGERSSATGIDGSQGDDSAGNSGAAYVFVRNATTWSQQAYLKASNTGLGDQFGSPVCVSGDTIVVGARNESSSATGVDGDQSNNNTVGSGAAYVFVRSATTWSQQAYLKASNTGANDQFGFSLAVSFDTIVVGAYGEDSSAFGVNGVEGNDGSPDSGAAYVFVRNATTWSQQAYLKASTPGSNDLFGVSVSVSVDTIVVGAPQEDSGATGVNGTESDVGSVGDSGAAYVFVRNATTWSQQAYLKASNTGAVDQFGSPVCVSGDTIVVGAQQEDSSATGVDGDQGNNGAAVSGAAYVFVRSATTWSRQAYLKASNTGANDLFGFSVAVSVDTIVVGARHEDGGATGVNGNQSDETAQTAGAVYVFAVPVAPPPPPPPPVGYCLPAKVKAKVNAKRAEKSTLTASGNLETGTGVPDFAGAATFDVGGFHLDVPAFVAKGKSLTFTAGGITLTITPAKNGSSHAVFSVKAVGDLAGKVDLNGPLAFNFTNAANVLNGTANLTAGKLGPHAVTAPTLSVLKSAATIKSGGKDALKLTLGFATDGAVPAAGEDLTISFGGTYTTTLAGGWIKKGATWTHTAKAPGITKATIDYAKGTITIAGSKLDLGAFATGGNAVVVTVTRGSDARSASIRMAKAGTKLSY